MTNKPTSSKNNNQKLILPELLAPAGSFECLKAAVQNGADAVYLGLKKGSARMGAENFTFEQLKQAIQYSHIYGVKVYLALNTLFNRNELSSAYDDAKKAAELGIDAIIIQDIGLAEKIFTSRHNFPCEIHASTQMSIYNDNGLRFIEALGFDRCITARELSINEIKNLCKNSNIEIEVFCHGALCMSVSGQCLLSSFIGGRSGNRGTCAQPCRLKYALKQEPFYNNLSSETKTSILCNEKTFAHAYRLSPADFAALPHLRELVKTGIHSLKIEGRLKSPEYVAAVTQSYRTVLNMIKEETCDDNNAHSIPNIEKNMYNMQLLFGRGNFSSGYLYGKIPFKDITFQTSGRIGVKIGKILDFPKILPSPQNLPSSLTRFRIKAETFKNNQLHIGDGITVYDPSNEYNIVCGGTVNSINYQKVDKKASQAIKHKNTSKSIENNTNTYVELIVVGKINKNFCKNTNFKNLNAKEKSNSLDSNYELAITDDITLRNELKRITNSENKRIPINFFFRGEINKIPSLKISDNDGNEIVILGENPLSEAANAPIHKDNISKQLSKLGDTPFFANNIYVEMNENIFIPISYINSLRRNATSALIDARAKRLKVHTPKAQSIVKINSHEASKGISLFFYRIEKFISYSFNSLPKLLKQYQKETLYCYIPLNSFYKCQKSNSKFKELCNTIINLKNSYDCKIIAYFNLISLGEAYKSTNEELPDIISNYLGSLIDGFMLENPGDIFTLNSAFNKLEQDITNTKKQTTAKPIICCDYSFNIINQEAIMLLEKFGISRITFSPEASIDDLPNIKLSKSSCKINTELIIGGKIILMRSRHCYIDEGNCSGKRSKCKEGSFSLIDNQNCIFPILPQQEDCCSILLSHKDLSFTSQEVKEIRNSHPDISLRINIL